MNLEASINWLPDCESGLLENLEKTQKSAFFRRALSGWLNAPPFIINEKRPKKSLDKSGN
jgi:hypothetical protein